MKTGTVLKLCRVQLAARPSKNGYSVYIRYTHEGHQFKQTVGFVPRGNREAWRRIIEQGKIIAQQYDAELTSRLSGLLHITSKDKSFLEFFKHFARTKEGTTAATYQTCEKLLLKFVSPMNDITFAQITEDFCTRFRDYLLMSDLQQSTAVLYYSKFKSVVNEAFRRKLIAFNPVAAIKLPRTRARKEILSPDEIQRFLAVEPQGKHARCLRNLFLFLLATGVRIGDALSVRFSDVKMLDGKAVLTFVMQKTEKLHHLPLNELAKRCISDQRRFAPNDDAKIFHDAPSYRRIVALFEAWSEKAISRKITPHALRHTCATLMLQKGDVKSVAEILGHSSIAITNTYLHSSLENVLSTLTAIDDFALKLKSTSLPE